MAVVTKTIGTGIGSAGTGNVDSVGTTAITSGSVATAFTSELTAPGTIEIAGTLYNIASITDDDNLVTVETVPSGTNQSYNIGLRHYSTITLWEADLDDSGIYSNLDDAVGECYNDSVFSEPSITFEGGSTVGLTSVTLKPASGERHDGTAGTGVVVSPNALMYEFINLNWDFECLVEGIEIDGNDDCERRLVNMNAAAADDITLNALLVHNLDGNSGSDMIAVGKSTNSSTYDLLNCIIYDIQANVASNRNVCGFRGSLSVTTLCYNNTIHNVGRLNGTGSADAYGIERFISGTLTATNNIVTDVTNDDVGGVAECFNSGVTQSYNASDDATASGTGSIPNITAANQFVSTILGSEDLHLKTGSDAIDAGTDLGTTPTGVEIDIDGRDRDAEGDTWDMGAHELVVVGGGFDPVQNQLFITRVTNMDSYW